MRLKNLIDENLSPVLVETARATQAWDVERGRPPIDRGFTPEQEAEVLASS